MAILDLILNLAGLLLWFGWQQSRPRLVVPAAGVSLLSTLRRADAGQKRNHLLSLLGVLLLGRFLLYWQLGQAVNWIASLPVGLVPVSFRSRYWDHMLLYSIGSFLQALAVAYLWLVLLSLLHPNKVDHPQHRFVREQLGWLDRWPAGLRVLLPFFAIALVWLAVGPLLEWFGLLPAPKSIGHRLQQAAVHGVAFYLESQWLVVGLLGLGLLHSYVYLGKAPFWTYVQTATQTLLWPLRAALSLPLLVLSKCTRRPGALLAGQLLTLQIGRVDFVPLLGLVLVLLGCRAAWKALAELYIQLPLV